MAFVIASATVQLSADTQPLHRALAESRSALARFVASNTAQVRTLRDGLGVLSRVASPRLVGAPGKAPGDGRASSGRGALSAAHGVGAASDLNAAIARAGVAFGSDAHAIRDVAHAMAHRFGVVKQQVLDVAGAFGLMRRAAGMSARDAAATSASLATAAADVKALQNLPVTAVLTKLRSGLSGAMGPLRAPGAGLSGATAQAEAVRLGIARAGKELTQAQRTPPHAALMLRGAADANGDRPHTAGSAANPNEAIGRRTRNTLTNVGPAILPAWTSARSRINTGLKDLAGWFDRNRATVRDQALHAGAALSVVLAGWGRKLAANVLPAIGRAIAYVDDAFTSRDRVAESSGVDLATALSHLGERIQRLREVAAALLDRFGDNRQTPLTAAFDNAHTIFEDLGANLQALTRAIPASFSGEGWNSKATAVTRGLRTNATERKTPTLNLSDFNAQRAEIKDRLGTRINERDEARRKSRAKTDSEEPTALGNDEEAMARETPDMFTDPAAFAKHLQQHLFGQDVQQKQLSALQNIATNTQTMASDARKRGCDARATLTAPD